MRKKRERIVTVPYGYNPHITCYTELDFGNHRIRPGAELKIKNTRGVFIFHKWVHNAELDVTWIDCMDKGTGEFRSFYMDRLKKVILPKKSRGKKISVQ